MLNVKPFKSSPAHCGPGVMKMLLEYYGIEKAEKELAKAAKWNLKGGVSSQNMIKAMKKYGFKGAIRDNSSLKDIRHYVIGKKMPLIVEWFLEDESHFSIVVDINKDNICLMDPFIEKMRKLPLGHFDRVWFGFEGAVMKSKNDLFLRRMVVLQKK